MQINFLPITTVLATLIMNIPAVCAEDAVPPNPCTGPSALLALLDRPTVSDSACVVQYGQAVLELGYQHANLTGTGGQYQ